MSRLGDAWRVLIGKAKPRRAKSRSRSVRMYDVAKLGPADGMFADPTDVNAEVFASLERTRDTSRKMYRDNPYYRRIVDAFVNAIVSTGLMPTIDTGDRMVRHPRTGKQVKLSDFVYETWEAWGKVCVPGSKITIYGLQQLLCRAWIMDGEGLGRIRSRFTADMPGMPPIKIQPLEADFLPVDKSETVPNSSNRIYAGVEFDGIGELYQYHVLKDHPGKRYPFSVFVSQYDTTPIPAESMIHLFRPERAGQVRGMPLASGVIIALNDLAGYMEAVRVGTRAAACIAVTVAGGEQEDGQPPNGLANEGANGGTPEEDGAVLLDATTGQPVEGVGPGMVTYTGKDGKTVTVHTPQPPSGVADYVNAQLHEIASGANMSYHVLSGDMSDSSFAQAKLGLLEQARNINVLREQTFCPVALDPIWRAFIDAGIAIGLWPDDERLYRNTWSKPDALNADRYTESKADQMDMRLGLRSRREIIESRGRDPDVVDAEIALDKANRKRLGIVSDGDPSETMLAGGAQPAVSSISDDLNNPESQN